jgi:hypothetical protein
MRSLVVYESWFGNTGRIAEQIASVLDADLVSVDDPLPSLDGVDLIVVGGPTHVHGLSSGRSRAAALDQSSHDAEAGIGVRGWIDGLPDGGPQVAVFDTRAHKPAWLVGSAAQGMARRLRRRGYRLAVEPQSFYVQGTPGPLEAGEVERAAEWAKELESAVLSPAA